MLEPLAAADRRNAILQMHLVAAFASTGRAETRVGGLRRNANKVRPALPTNILADQTEIRFVYKRCALKRMPRTLPAQIRRRKTPHFCINDRKMCIDRLLLAC